MRITTFVDNYLDVFKSVRGFMPTTANGSVKRIH